MDRKRINTSELKKDNNTSESNSSRNKIIEKKKISS